MYRCFCRTLYNFVLYCTALYKVLIYITTPLSFQRNGTWTPRLHRERKENGDTNHEYGTEGFFMVARKLLLWLINLWGICHIKWKYCGKVSMDCQTVSLKRCMECCVMTVIWDYWLWHHLMRWILRWILKLLLFADNEVFKVVDDGRYIEFVHVFRKCFSCQDKHLRYCDHSLSCAIRIHIFLVSFINEATLDLFVKESVVTWMIDHAFAGNDRILCTARIHDDVMKLHHFRLTGPLWGESTCNQWIPFKGPVTQSFDVFFDLLLKKRLRQQPRLRRADQGQRTNTIMVR